MPSNSERRRPWLWRCPHCLGGNMSLESALKHMRRRHFECWSCQIEQKMCQAMVEGRGLVFEGPFPFGRRNGVQHEIVAFADEIEWMN